MPLDSDALAGLPARSPAHLVPSLTKAPENRSCSAGSGALGLNGLLAGALPASGMPPGATQAGPGLWVWMCHWFSYELILLGAFAVL